MRNPSWAGSILLHVGAVLALLLLWPSESIQPTVLPVSMDVTPLAKPDLPQAPKAMGGGGGGQESKPAAHGRLPRVAPRTFTPPPTKIPDIDPVLPVEPTLVAAPSIDIAVLRLGDPLGLPGPPSDGTGKRGGIGTGSDGGVGTRVGPRAGNGPGFAGAYSIAAVSAAPVLIHKVDPEFTEEARKARFNGTVVLRVIIDDQGRPAQIEVVRAPGLGLGERAIASVSQWRFRPGRRDGKPVAVWATVEVNFSLL